MAGRPVSVVAAVRRELDVLERNGPGLLGSPEGVLAVSLAKRIDDPLTRATAVAQLAGRLLETMVVLRGMVPSVQASPLDDIRARRADRVAAGVAAAADRVGSRRGGSS